MKKYRAIFFDWDGTAVINRKANADKVICAMRKLLQNKIYLIIVSGTTYENICNGNLEDFFSLEELQYLYLGLGRGNYNYGYLSEKKPILLKDLTPNIEQLAKLHKVCFQLHLDLLYNYFFKTDIIFSRPNYCKLDLMVDTMRGNDELFLQKDEISQLEFLLKKHNINGGLISLLQFADNIGYNNGLTIKSTTDAKYLEVGYTTKSDNIKWFMKHLMEKGIHSDDCCFWGDEFGAITPGIWGSDSQMIIEETKSCNFFSVSDIDIPLPNEVKKLGGGVDCFIHFLEDLGKEYANDSK